MAKGTVAVKFVGDVADLKKSLGEAESKLSGFAKSGALLGAAAGVAVGAALVKGLSDAINIEQANDKLAAQLGLSVEEAEEYGEAAGNVYASAWGDSIEHVNQAIGAVGSTLSEAIEPGQEALEEATTKALALAEAFDIDVSQAVNTAGIMFQSGLVDNADEAFDLLTVGLQAMPAAIREELLEATNEYGTFFAGLGISAEDTFGILTTAAEDGMYGIDKTGDAIKEFTIRSTDMSKLTGEAFDTIGVDMEEMTNRILAGGDDAGEAFAEIVEGLLSIEDPGQQAEAAIALFGTPIEDLNVKDIPLFLEGLANMDSGLGDVEGAASAMADTLSDNAGTKIEAFKRQALQGIAEFVAEYVIPAAEAMGEWFGETLPPIIEGVQEVFEKIGPPIKEVLEDFSGWVKDNDDKVRALAFGVGTVLVAAIAVYMAMMAKAAVATVIATWPFILAALAVGAIAAALYWAYTENEDFRESVDKAIPYVFALGTFIAITAGHVRSFVGWLIDAVKWLDRLLSKIPGLGGLGGFFGTAFKMSNPVPWAISKLHTGGIFQAGGGGREGLALLESGEGVFTPGQMRALGGRGGQVVNINVSGTFLGTNQTQLKRDLVALLGKAGVQGIRA